MKDLQTSWRMLTTSALFMALLAMTLTARADDAPSGLAVRDVANNGTTVTGWVVNETSHEVRDVRLVVEQQFRWAQEMKPGDDNPGSSTVVRVPEAIPAGARVQFRYDLSQPQPQRTDGHFETEVKVLSFSEHWTAEPAASLPQRAVAQ